MAAIPVMDHLPVLSTHPDTSLKALFVYKTVEKVMRQSIIMLSD